MTFSLCLTPSPRAGHLLSDAARASAGRDGSASAEILLEIPGGSFVVEGVMSADANLPAKAFDDVSFDEFYERALPVVFGYLLRLCGGDPRRRGISPRTAGSPSSIGSPKDRPTRRRSGSCCRSRVRAISTCGDVSGGCDASCAWCGPMPAGGVRRVVRGRGARSSVGCSDEHRVVLMLAYVDGIPVAEIAEMLGSSVSSTYSLLARAQRAGNHLTGDQHDESLRRDEGCTRPREDRGTPTASARTHGEHLDG